MWLVKNNFCIRRTNVLTYIIALDNINILKFISCAMSLGIKAYSLFKSFGDNCVLRGISANFNPSTSTVLLGGSGSGKSVFIKILSGLMPYEEGVVEIDGYDIAKLSKKDRSNILDQMGFLFQGGALFDSLKIWENVAFKLVNKYNVAKSKARDVALEKLSLVGLKPGVADLYPYELSGGMQKRAALARTIASDPKVLFFDEPTTGLDPVMSEVINNLIIKCSNHLKSTSIIVTHDMHSARRIGNMMYFLYRGNFIWNGKNQDLDASGNSYLDQFIQGRIDGPIVL